MTNKITESTPFYAAAGAGDLAVEKLRQVSDYARAKLADLHLDPSTMSKDLTERVDSGLSTVRHDVQRLPDELKHLPEEFRSEVKTWSEQARTAAEKARASVTHTYDELAERGRDVVARVRSGEDVHELEERAGRTVSDSKAAVTTASRSGSSGRKATTKRAKATATEARKTAQSARKAASEAANEVGKTES